MNKGILIGSLLALVFLTACSAPKRGTTATDTFERIRQQAIANAGSEFERLCYENNHGWMKNMMPMKKGVPLADKPCDGCMAEANTHLCDEVEYRAYIGK